MLQVELGAELEDRLASTAQAQGLSVDEYLRDTLEQTISFPRTRTPEEQAKRDAAIQELMDFGKKYKFTLGPDLTIKDLINEGRR